MNQEFKTTLAAAKRLRNHLNSEYKTPITLSDCSEFEWREFIVAPYDKTVRKAFITSYETNIHNTTPDNLIQSFLDKHYTVALILNSSPLSHVWIDMSVDEFVKRAGIKLDLEPFE